MNYRNNAELQERLAAEYALGTLRGRARTRFKRWLREDAALARTVAKWERHLMPMAVAVEPVRPPARLWRDIEARIGGERRGGGAGFWRALALLTSGATAALVAAVVLVTPPASAPVPAPVVGMPAGYVAVLSEPKTQKAVLVVMAGRNEERLWVQALDPAIRVPNQSLELWALPAGGAAPRSLGVIGAAERSSLALRAVADRALGDVPALAVSLEPEGGSKTGAPTGPVLYVGPCVRNW